MKKIYTSPAIEIENIEVEQGIAMSTIEAANGFDLSGAGYEEEDFVW